MDKYDSLKLENQLCFPLYAASREIVKLYYPYLTKLGITYTQYITLMVLWDAKSISSKELGKKLFLDSGTLSPLLKDLEKKGFITRTRSKDDERNLIVEITSEGMALRDQALEVPMMVSGCISLPPDEAITLYKTLYKILDELK
ncbi:MAG: MarR family transcriptional regulator [Clostridia bacterium]|nr:MarR family transcriptional regulator [Clostridia bacterium]